MTDNYHNPPAMPELTGSLQYHCAVAFIGKIPPPEAGESILPVWFRGSITRLRPALLGLAVGVVDTRWDVSYQVS